MKKTITVQELFNDLFDKARAGGWKPEETMLSAIEWGGMTVPVNGVVFDHGFLKGLFGIEMINEKGDPAVDKNKDKDHIWQPAWKYHGKRMVVCDDVIKYLADYMNY